MTPRATTKKVEKAPAKKAPAKPKAVKVKAPVKVKASAKVVLKEKGGHLRIKVSAYENKILDQSVKQIMDTVSRYDAVIRGPVPLPTEIKKFTVNRSSFIDKNSREQFEIRTHKRLIDIVNPDQKIVEALTNLNLPSGVNVDVKMM